MPTVAVLDRLYPVSIETLDIIAREWALKINGQLMPGFASRYAALDYYRAYVLRENPNTVSLMFSYVGAGIDFQLAYVIL